MSEDGRGNADNPGVIAPPPLIYAGTLAAGLLANRRLRPPFPLPRRLSRTLGVLLFVGGGLVGLLGVLEMRRVETNANPRRPATAVVTEGPYRVTRNPMYVGFTLQYVGIAAFVRSLVPLLFLPAVFAVMRRGVIEREERYMEGKFGAEYLQYREKVRRWI